MQQITTFSPNELKWMLTGGVVSARIGGTKHEYMLESTYKQRRDKANDTTETNSETSPQ